MKLLPITSGRLFQVTVLLLGIPAVLLLVITIVFVLIRVVTARIGGGIGGFAFAITSRELFTAAAITLGVFLLLCFVAGALVRRHN